MDQRAAGDSTRRSLHVVVVCRVSRRATPADLTQGGKTKQKRGEEHQRGSGSGASDLQQRWMDGMEWVRRHDKTEAKLNVVVEEDALVGPVDEW